MKQVKTKCRICGVEGESTIPDDHKVVENTAICLPCARAEKILILECRRSIEGCEDKTDDEIIQARAIGRMFGAGI